MTEKKYPFDYVKYDVDRNTKIATVTLSNPGKRNAMPFWGEDQLLETIDQWEKDDDVKVVIIRGEGDDFCSGHDLEGYFEGFGLKSKTKAKKANRHQLILERNVRETWRRLFYSLKPTIAEVRGQCIELGNALQVCCDITIAADDCNIGNLGQAAGISGITIIRLYAHLIGYKRTREMMVSGRTWSGHDASLIGLVNRAVAVEELQSAALAEAQRIALIPIDGLVMGKSFAHVVWDSMGMGQAFTESYFGHAFGLKMGFEENEFAFFREVREHGGGKAVKKRHELYNPHGGFGAKSELPIVPLSRKVTRKAAE